MHQD
jgi:Na+/H+-translocating membrane pyrophosphatase